MQLDRNLHMPEPEKNLYALRSYSDPTRQYSFCSNDMRPLAFFADVFSSKLCSKLEPTLANSADMSRICPCAGGPKASDGTAEDNDHLCFGSSRTMNVWRSEEMRPGS